MQSEYGTLNVKTERLFGFIRPQRGGGDVFIHLDDFVAGADAWAGLEVGSDLTYDLQKTPKGLRATNCREVLKCPAPD